MTFEIYEKGNHIHGGLKDNQISVGKSTMGLGLNAENFLKKDYVEIWLDRDNLLVGLKPTNDGIKGFKIQSKGPRNKRKSIVGSFTKLLPPGWYDCWTEGGLMVFKVPEIAKKI